MASTTLLPARHYLNDGYGVASWLLTRDHKRIALLYLAAVTVLFFIGGAFAVMIRLDLATPAGETFPAQLAGFVMAGVGMVVGSIGPQAIANRHGTHHHIVGVHS